MVTFYHLFSSSYALFREHLQFIQTALVAWAISGRMGDAAEEGVESSKDEKGVVVSVGGGGVDDRLMDGFCRG